MNHIDEIIKKHKVDRIIYGYDIKDKPNENCYWNKDGECWEENDLHLRNRIKEMMK